MHKLSSLLPRNPEPRERRPLSARWRLAITSTSITLVIIACAVLLNVLAVVVTERYPLSIDLTREQVFRLSDESINYLRSLDKDVVIYVLADEAAYASGNQYFKQAYEVIKKYDQYSDRVTVEFVDVAANPSFVNRWPGQQLAEGSLIVTCGDSFKVLDDYDLFDIEYSWSTYTSSIVGSKAEQSMTSAILNVTSSVKPLVAFISGHDEADTAGFRALLESNGFRVSEFKTLTEDVPAEAMVLVLTAPANDLAQSELDKLQAWLTGATGTARHLIYMASVKQRPLPALEAWLSQWGIVVEPGAVVETSASRVMSSNAYYGLADMVDPALTRQMTSGDAPLILPLTRPLRLAFESSLGYRTAALLQYSATAGIADENAASLADIAVSGPITVGARSFNGESSVIVYGSEQLIESSLLQSTSVANESYILSVLNTLCKREETVAIPSKAFSAGTFLISQREQLLYAALFGILLPLGVLITGLTIWFRRRRL